ncbi:DUF3800 domain-containing protein [Phenylobacterium sp.]|uniref:DUF3800 domain-containing protein n=1 Tax=Phenylobacterium sp. TaxID=1871053 RepID=UPI002FCC69DB
MAQFSDYIVFVDESGSAVLDGIDPDFPIFVLACVLVRKDRYATEVVPSLQKLKFDFVGHDQLVLHERDIRRQQKDFAFLQVDSAGRTAFLERVNQVVHDAPIDVIAAVINKPRLMAKYADPWSPYEIALHFCMEKLLARLTQVGETGRLIHVMFEARGRKEDAELELHFRRVASNRANWGYKAPDFTALQWEPVFVDKKSNSSGLQLADLMARPIGLKALRPMQENRAFEVMRPKLALGGMKTFP